MKHQIDLPYSCDPGSMASKLTRLRQWRILWHLWRIKRIARKLNREQLAAVGAEPLETRA